MRRHKWWALPPAAGFKPSDIPQSEADALIAFYNATAGASWTNNTNWLTDPVVNNWNGVTVVGGHVTQIGLSGNNLVGVAGNTLDPLAGSLARLYCSSNSILAFDSSVLTALTHLYINDNSIPTLDLSALANGTVYINAADNNMVQAEVNSMINDIWTRKDDWTDATPELHVGGTNATPTGVYQDGYPLPLTALEKVHDLINDDDTAGIQVWAAISWNGGSAP